MLIAGQLLIPAGPRAVRLQLGWIDIRAGRIHTVQLGPCPCVPDIGGNDYFISPGFIDTHVHLPQFKVMGYDGLPLLEWLEQGVFPEEARWSDTGYAAERAERALRQLLSFGTTSCCAYATVHATGTVAAIEVAARLKMQAAIGQVLMDTNSPSELQRPTQQLLHECAQLAAQYAPTQHTDLNRRVEYAVTPRFAITCTAELMSGAGEIAQRHQSVVQTHLAETIPECHFVAELFPNRTYTQVYDEAGLLGPRSLLGHGIHLLPEERELLQQRGSIVAHCPVANNFLQSGIMPRSRWLTDQLRVSLGSDVGAGTERSMIRVARAMLEAAKTLRFQDELLTVPTAAEAWWQITAGNAQLVGWHNIGQLVAGNVADLCISKPDHDWLHAPDPLAVLLYTWDDRWLQQVLVAGEIAFER
jgi:guanine deaminase